MANIYRYLQEDNEDQGGFEKRKKKQRFDDEIPRDITRDKKRKKKELDLKKQRETKRNYLED